MLTLAGLESGKDGGVLRRYTLSCIDAHLVKLACTPAGGEAHTSSEREWHCSNKTWLVLVSPVAQCFLPPTWTCSAPSHILNTRNRVVFAEGGRGLVRLVAAGVANTGVYMLDAGFRLLPIVILNLLLRLMARCALRTAASCRLKRLRGARSLTSLSGGETGAMPISMPTMSPSQWGSMVTLVLCGIMRRCAYKHCAAIH